MYEGLYAMTIKSYYALISRNHKRTNFKESSVYLLPIQASLFSFNQFDKPRKTIYPSVSRYLIGDDGVTVVPPESPVYKDLRQCIKVKTAGSFDTTWLENPWIPFGIDNSIRAEAINAGKAGVISLSETVSLPSTVIVHAEFAPENSSILVNRKVRFSIGTSMTRGTFRTSEYFELPTGGDLKLVEFSCDSARFVPVFIYEGVVYKAVLNMASVAPTAAATPAVKVATLDEPSSRPSRQLLTIDLNTLSPEAIEEIQEILKREKERNQNA
jgi:hypothetical protein